MDLGGQAYRVKLVIRDRGSNFTTAFDAALAGAGIRTVLCNIRTPRMNAIAERQIGGCRRGILAPPLIWNQTPPAADPARLRDPSLPASAAPFPARRRAAETTTRAGRPRSVSRPKTRSRRWPDQRISPGHKGHLREGPRSLPNTCD